jgi:hypothetical protein
MPAANCEGTLRSDEAERRTEGELVSRILCRLERLKRIGCERPDCLVLASRLDVDLDRAVELVRHGCPPALALRILI